MKTMNTALRRIGVRAPSDFIGSLLLLGFAIVVWTELGEMNMGFVSMISAATVPRYYLGFSVVMGLIVLLGSFLHDGDGIALPKLRSTAFVIGAIVVFGFAVRPMGLLIAGFFATFIASFATPEVRLVEALVCALGLAVFCVVVFVYALGLYLPVFPESW